MRVNANTGSDYLLVPHYDELAQFLAVFDGLVQPCPGGWTFKAYAAVPGVMVKGNIFTGKTPEKTRSFDTATEALHSLKLGVETTGGTIVDVSKGLFLPLRSIHRSPLGIVADHIPQIYGAYPLPSMPGRVCVAVSGDYNFATRAFAGMVEFADLGAVWKG